uniref:Uncharacterized protein LOC104241146 n=1 Tax=Nicotiana sylvestris TaxID=4096 RepID=A0A1U7XQM1_NICSY|nr:PREDICTED: uncharacterized protein LOC104241146 [Nicotiana sylvestris]
MDQDMSRWHIWDDMARHFVRQFQYNIDINPDRNSLSNLKKKSSESFREYAIKWRKQEVRVKPLMDETEMERKGMTLKTVGLSKGQSKNKEFDPALKSIIAIANMERKPKAAAKQDKGEKKSNSTPRSEEKTVETKIGAAPPKDAILYVP